MASDAYIRELLTRQNWLLDKQERAQRELQSISQALAIGIDSEPKYDDFRRTGSFTADNGQAAVASDAYVKELLTRQSWLLHKQAQAQREFESVAQALTVAFEAEPAYDEFRKTATVAANGDNVRAMGGPKRVPNTAEKEPVGPKPQRQRGILAKVEAIVNSFEHQVFDKNDVRKKLQDSDAESAAKITRAHLRDALRQLYQRGSIEVLTDATSTTCAKYRRVA